MITKRAIFYKIDSDYVNANQRKVKARVFSLSDKTIVKFALGLDNVSVPGLHYVIKKIKLKDNATEILDAELEMFTPTHLKALDAYLAEVRDLVAPPLLPKVPPIIPIEEMGRQDDGDDVGEDFGIM